MKNEGSFPHCRFLRRNVDSHHQNKLNNITIRLLNFILFIYTLTITSPFSALDCLDKIIESSKEQSSMVILKGKADHPSMLQKSYQFL